MGPARPYTLIIPTPVVGWKHPQSHTAIILSPDKYSLLYPRGVVSISTSVVHNNSSSFSNAVLFSVCFHKLLTIIYLDVCMLLLKYWCYSNFFADLPAFISSHSIFCGWLPKRPKAIENLPNTASCAAWLEESGGWGGGGADLYCDGRSILYRLP